MTDLLFKYLIKFKIMCCQSLIKTQISLSPNSLESEADMSAKGKGGEIKTGISMFLMESGFHANVLG